MRQAIEKMEYHRYTAVPLVDQHGHYVGTITEGDLLWKMKSTPCLTFENTDKIPVLEIPRRVKNETVRIEANVESLINLAIIQNFVPVLDDEDIFIGIIRRREIMEYFSKKLLDKRLL